MGILDVPWDSLLGSWRMRVIVAHVSRPDQEDHADARHETTSRQRQTSEPHPAARPSGSSPGADPASIPVEGEWRGHVHARLVDHIQRTAGNAAVSAVIASVAAAATAEVAHANRTRGSGDASAPLQRDDDRYIPYEHAPGELRPEIATNDVAALARMTLDELIPLFAVGWRLHRVPSTREVYTREWALGDVGTARLLGWLRVRLAEAAADPDAEATLLDTVDRTRGMRSRLEELRRSIRRAFERAEQGLTGASGLVEAGRQGRTMQPRGADHPGRIHAAMDVPGARGTPVYTALDGRVLFAGRKSGYGNLVIVLHEGPDAADAADAEDLGRVTSAYAHLDALAVSAGEEVSAGNAVGTMGNSGAGEGRVRPHMGVHLHFSVQRLPPDVHPSEVPRRFSSRYEERADIRINPALWLGRLGTGITPVQAPTWEGEEVEPAAPEVQRTRETRHVDRSALRPMLGHLPVVQRHTPVWLLEGVRLAALLPRLIDETVGLAEGGATLVRADDVRAALDQAEQDDALARAVAAAARRVNGADDDERDEAFRSAAEDVLRAVERQFILEPDASTLDLLPPDRAEHYRNFDWQRLDFPGRGGPNQASARRMRRELAAVRPERRSNVGTSAVVTRQEANAAMRRYIQSELVAVPDQGRHRLNRHAEAAFTEMAAAAADEGVTLQILSSHRTFATSQRRARATGVATAVASFSSHNLGLAVDLEMSAGTQRFRETTTRPFQNVVDMRQSPAHKWLFLRGAEFGWFPYHNEPWHWEYNPAGFRQQFRQNLNQQAGAAGGSP